MFSRRRRKKPPPFCSVSSPSAGGGGGISVMNSSRQVRPMAAEDTAVRAPRLARRRRVEAHVVDALRATVAIVLVAVFAGSAADATAGTWSRPFAVAPRHLNAHDANVVWTTSGGVV